MTAQARRFQYVNSLFESGITIAGPAAGVEICRLPLDTAPHGVYSLVVGFGIAVGPAAAVDFRNGEVRKNGQRLFTLTTAVAMQQGFLIILDPRDVLTVNVGPSNATATAVYVSTLQLTLIQELATNQEEAPDTMAVLASQQQRIGDALDRLVQLMEAFKG